MTEEERKQLVELLCKLTYLEWKKLSHAIGMAFTAKTNSVANKETIDTELAYRWIELES